MTSNNEYAYSNVMNAIEMYKREHPDEHDHTVIITSVKRKKETVTIATGNDWMGVLDDIRHKRASFLSVNVYEGLDKIMDKAKREG